MSDDTVSLREYFESKLCSLEKLLKAEEATRETALRLARTELEGRLEKLNELRSDVVKDRQEYIRRDVFDASITDKEKRLTTIERWQSKIMGQMIVISSIGITIGSILGAVVASIIIRFLFKGNP